MNELFVYHVIIVLYVVIAIIIFVSLFFITAPYGRHIKSGWGPMLHNKLGWILMEAPPPLLFIYYALTGNRELNYAYAAIIFIWMSHYLHRSIIYPFTLRSTNKISFSILLFGFSFNVCNTYVQGRCLFSFSPVFSASWLMDPRFIAGVIIFYCGYIINKHSDYLLRILRKPGESGYKIPSGGFYRWVSCPNYLGEIIEWTGWAVLTWSTAGAVFAFWTAANLIPRAYSHHKWYKSKFPEYPPSRKAVIPYVF